METVEMHAAPNPGPEIVVTKSSEPATAETSEADLPEKGATVEAAEEKKAVQTAASSSGTTSGETSGKQASIDAAETETRLPSIPESTSEDLASDLAEPIGVADGEAPVQQSVVEENEVTNQIPDERACHKEVPSIILERSSPSPPPSLDEVPDCSETGEKLVEDTSVADTSVADVHPPVADISVADVHPPVADTSKVDSIGPATSDDNDDIHYEAVEPLRDETQLQIQKRMPQKSDSLDSVGDTCCTRLAEHLLNKALEIATSGQFHKKRRRPALPPKPSAEAVARARAAKAAALGCGFGDQYPGGRDGFRYMDDVSETSADYKDVDLTSCIEYRTSRGSCTEDAFQMPKKADTVDNEEGTVPDEQEETPDKNGSVEDRNADSLTDVSLIRENEESCVEIAPSGTDETNLENAVETDDTAERRLQSCEITDEASTLLNDTSFNTKEASDRGVNEVDDIDASRLSDQDGDADSGDADETLEAVLADGETVRLYILPCKPPRKKLRTESAENSCVESDYAVHSDLPTAESDGAATDELSQPSSIASLMTKDADKPKGEVPTVLVVKPPRPLSPPQIKPKPARLRKAPAVPTYAASTRKTTVTFQTTHKWSTPPVKPKPTRPAPKPLALKPTHQAPKSPEAKPSSILNTVVKNAHLNGFQSLPPASPKQSSPRSPRTPPPRPPLPQQARTQPALDLEKQKTDNDQSCHRVETPAENDRSGISDTELGTPEVSGNSGDPLLESGMPTVNCDPSLCNHQSDIDEEYHSSTDHVEPSLKSNSLERWRAKYLPQEPLTQFNIPDENSNVVESLDIASTSREASEIHSDGGVVSVPERKRRPAPKPPSRRRRRSRTVEIMPNWKPEDRSTRRSHSLSEADVVKRRETREMKSPFLSPASCSTAKGLYTRVSKETKTQDEVPDAGNQASPESRKMRFRPLPPPPPPPRTRSRSSGLSVSGGEDRSLGASKAFTDKGIQTDAFEVDENANVAQLDPHREEATRFELTRTQRPNYSVKMPDSLDEFDVVDSKATFHLPHTSYVGDGRRSASPSISERFLPSLSLKGKSRTSWYDGSEASGNVGDLDTSPSSSQPVSWERIDSFWSNRFASSPQESTAPRERRSFSTFYCDLDSTEPVFAAVNAVSRAEGIRTPESGKICVDKGVQTFIDLQKMSDVIGGSSDTVSPSEKSEDTDDLLNLAMNIKKELNIILERHKKPADTEDSSEEYFTAQGGDTASLSSDCNVGRHGYVRDEESSSSESFRPGRKKRAVPTSSTYSSASEFSWHESSSEESEDDTASKLTAEEKAERKWKRKVFFIAKELMTTEETFVDTLRLLNEDFKHVIVAASRDRGSAIVPPEVLNQMLKYLPQLQNLNESLLQEFKDRIEHWEEADKIADVLVKIGPFLKLYSSYIRDFEVTTSILEEARRKYPAFGQVIKEFQASPRCRNLALNHYMLKPVQRIPQYRLLLQEYLSHLPKEHWDYVDAETALHIVSQVADHANDTMRQGDNFAKLISIQNSIMGRYEIVKPGRTFIKEGELMKLSRKGLQPRRFMLFNDVLIYLTAVQPELYKVNHELPLAGMKVSIPVHQDYQNEFSIISVTRSFSLAASSPEEREEWICAIQHAISVNANKRSTFLNIRIQQKGQTGSPDSFNFRLGKQAPVWIPDARVTMCQLCTSEFTVTFRRHHCRSCGKVVCSACSSNRAPLHYLHYRSARVCNECFVKLQQEFEETQRSGKSSDDLGTLSESADGESDSPKVIAAIKAQFKHNIKHGPKKMKRPSVLKEVCANDQGSTISGYLQRQSRRGWKRSWFVLKDKVLYTYRASEDVAALGSKPLLGYTVQTFTKEMGGINPSLLFQLSHAGEPPIVFHADTVGLSERWVKAVQEATVLEPPAVVH